MVELEPKPQSGSCHRQTSLPCKCRAPEIPYTTLPHGLKVSSSLANTVFSTKPCPPLIPMRDLKGSMELATTEVRRSPRSLIASCQQAAELEEAGYSQARDRQIRARPQSPPTGAGWSPQEPSHQKKPALPDALRAPSPGDPDPSARLSAQLFQTLLCAP